MMLALAARPCTAAAGAPACPGDCDADGWVRVDELVTGVEMALGVQPPWRCPPFDVDADRSVALDELIAAVNAALAGGSPAPGRPRAPRPAPRRRRARDALPTPTATANLAGPAITFFGAARADDRATQPVDTLPDGTPVFLRPLGLGFYLVLEARRGAEVAICRSGRASGPPLVSSAAVCDAGPSPPLGGVPALQPPQFGPASPRASPTCSACPARAYRSRSASPPNSGAQAGARRTIHSSP